MKTLLPILLLSVVISCVSVRSNVKSDAVPTFKRVLVVTDMYRPPRNYEQQYLSVFPKEYEVCVVGVTPLTFNSDSLILTQARTCQSDVILTIKLTQLPGGSYNQVDRFAQSNRNPSRYFAEMRSAATGKPFWKAQLSAVPIMGRTFPPRAVVKRLLKDGILDGKMPNPNQQQALR